MCIEDGRKILFVKQNCSIFRTITLCILGVPIFWVFFYSTGVSYAQISQLLTNSGSTSTPTVCKFFLTVVISSTDKAARCFCLNEQKK